MRGQLLFTPTTDFKLRVIGDYGHQHSKTAAAVLTGVIRQYDNGITFANNYNDRAVRLGYRPTAIDPDARLVDVDANPRYKMSQWGVAASRYSLIPSYSLVNARTLDGLVDIQVWARNIADKLYYQSLSAGTTGSITGTLGDPQTYGVTLKTRF